MATSSFPRATAAVQVQLGETGFAASCGEASDGAVVDASSGVGLADSSGVVGFATNASPLRFHPQQLRSAPMTLEP